jgi:hypothetical protein
MEIHDLFFKMEKDEKLFYLSTEENLFYWDIIRREVFVKINKKILNNSNVVSTPFKRNKYKTLLYNELKKIKNIIIFNYLVYKKPKHLFTNFRRESSDSGYIDYISEDIFKQFKNDSISVEFIAKSRISFFKMLLGIDTCIPPISILERKFVETSQISKIIENAVYKHFGFKLIFEHVIDYSIQEFIQTNDFFNKVFKTINIKNVIGSNDGTLKGLYNSAKINLVNSIELQHGTSPGSIMWTYQNFHRDMSKYYYLPRFFLTFSDFWVDKIFYPVEKIISCGNNYFNIKNIKGNENIIIILNASNNDNFVKLASELSVFFPERIIYFKLHPEQFKIKNSLINIFSFHKNILVVSDDFNLKTLFKLCSHVIGVRSTFLYLSLQAGKMVYVKKAHNFNWDKTLLAYVSQFDSVEELAKLIKLKKIENRINVPVFFEKLDINVINKLIN